MNARPLTASRRILLSSPGTRRRPPASRFPLAEFRPSQCLFGADAQLAAFGAALGTLGATAEVLAFPELVSAPVTRGFCLGEAGEDSGCLHVRFGPPGQIRVLKGVATIAVLAGWPRADTLTLGRHPLAGARAMPAAVREVLAYAGESDGGTGLPGWFEAADLPEEPLAVADRRALLRPDSGLILRSAAGLEEAGWADELDEDMRSYLLERLLAEGRSAGDAILVPWNLANPASGVPDLLGKISAFAGDGRAGTSFLVAPFNEPGDGAETLRWAMSRESQGRAGHIMFARVRRPGGIALLRDLVRLAWIDGNDPERGWTRRRLASVGLPSLVFGGAETEGGDGIAGDERREIVASDEFGTRLHRIDTLSVRRLRALMARSGAEAKLRMRRAAASAIGDARLWFDAWCARERG